MANRDFRKNLALLCALAGGAAALSSINVPASAMEEAKLEQMKENNRELIDDFEYQYNYYYNNLAGRNGFQQTKNKYSKFIEILTAMTLVLSAKHQRTRTNTLEALARNERICKKWWVHRSSHTNKNAERKPRKHY